MAVLDVRLAMYSLVDFSAVADEIPVRFELGQKEMQQFCQMAAYRRDNELEQRRTSDQTDCGRMITSNFLGIPVVDVDTPELLLLVVE